MYFKKTININDNRILKYDVSPGFSKKCYTISEGFLEDGKVNTYYLFQGDDYGFNGWTYDNNLSELLFEFNQDHPLYIPLFHLLNYDDELIIDDDDTREVKKKYMRIFKENNKIYINFINNIKGYSGLIMEKFNIFIKNIAVDGRSKIDDGFNDTKERLFTFFNEVNELFTCNYHQVSVEEYMLISCNNEEKELAKTFKKDYKKRFYY